MGGTIQVEEAAVNNAVLGAVEEAPDHDVAPFMGVGRRRSSRIRGVCGRRRPGGMDGRLKGNCGRCEGGSGKGSNLVPKFIMAEDDEATAVTREGVLNGERCVAAITGCREVGRGKAITKVDCISKFQ